MYDIWNKNVAEVSNC